MKPHEEWLLKAAHDYRAATLLSSEAEPVLDVAIYHTQQVAEKALKGFLAFHRKGLEKILNPYSVAYRYPDVEMSPDSSQMQEALDACGRILHHVNAMVSGIR